jgi:hypothetical protein
MLILDLLSLSKNYTAAALARRRGPLENYGEMRLGTA